MKKIASLMTALILTLILTMTPGLAGAETAGTQETAQTAAPAETVQAAAPAAETAETAPAAETVEIAGTAAPAETEETAETAKPEPFAGYIHDPRENPKAMRDIVENPDAYYGFSPSPEEGSTLKDYVTLIDWTDPAQVAEARASRQAYHESLQELYLMITERVYAGEDLETIARAVSQRRNELRLEAYRDDPEGLAAVKKRNLEIYGDESGPTQDSLFEKYGSWNMVLYKALGVNPGMDACTGFYDEYYAYYDLEDWTDAEDAEDAE